MNRRWSEAAVDAGYAVRDVYRLYPDFQIDVSAEQAVLHEFKHLVFQHPLYWYAPPSLVKKWIEDVLTHGWAYGDGRVLAGRTWSHAITVGAGREEYGENGSRRYELFEFLRPLERTAAFCGLEWLPPFLTYGAGYAGETELAESSRNYVQWLDANSPARTQSQEK